MANTNTVTNVTAGKPKKTGAIFRAPLGTTLPTSADAELDQAFVGLGYAGENGLTNADSPDTDVIHAWGGDPVLNIENAREDTFNFKLLEGLNVNVLKAIYGDNNVTGTLETGITITVNANEQPEYAWVFDMIMRGGVLKRIVLPCAKISEVGEVVYGDDDAVGYDTTLLAMPDDAGNTHYEYLKAA